MHSFLSEYFEISDVLKALVSLLAGVILGYERELKDKSAGLKTITIICLGSTLFTILSYKFSGDGDPTRIASYVVSGIGFLGAGVIFKEGFNVYGLTTAGIIWIAAAIGMSIGFGEILLAFVFLALSFSIIYSSSFLNRFFLTQHSNKVLTFELDLKNAEQRFEIIKNIQKFSKMVKEMSLEKRNESLYVTIDVHIRDQNLNNLNNYLLSVPIIRNFQI